MYDNNYYYYDTNEFPWQITTEKKHKSAIGFNTAQNGELAEVIIPLSQTNTYLSLYEIPV